MQDWVLTPLEMRDSTFEQPLPVRFRNRFAHGHLADGREVAGGAHIYPEQAAAGLWTTPSDLAKFVLAVRDSARGTGNFLSRDAVADLLKPAFENYALGLAVLGEGPTLRFTHQGGNAGYKARFVMYVASGDGVIVMTNSDNGMYLVNEVFRAVAQAYGWPDLQPRTAKIIAADRAQLARFAGVYQFDEASERGDNRIEFVVAKDRCGLILPDIGLVDLVATAPGQMLAPETGLTVELVEREAQTSLKIGRRNASRLAASR
jgi:CubicO group peptidase (beta-lactamase class C family)